MKKLILGLSLLTIGSVILPPSVLVYASENSSEITLNENTENVVIEYTKDGLVVTQYEDGYSAKDFADYSEIQMRAAVSRWGKTEYTNLALPNGVVAGAINTALYNGVGSVLRTFGGIPGWAITGLLNGAGWTQRGSKPGQAVANLWDKNKNGYVGFYYQRGYDAAGRVVATRYSTL